MSNENISTTYPIRMNENIKDELKELIDGYREDVDGTAGDFIELLLKTYKGNKLTDVKSEIRELNELTVRIYSIYSNLVEKNEVSVNNLQAQYSETIEAYEKDIKRLQNDLAKEVEKNETISSHRDKLAKSSSTLEKEMVKHANSLEKSDKLIDKLELELKELNQTKQLNSRLEIEIGGYESELKNMTAREKNLLTDMETKQIKIDELTKERESIKLIHEEELERVLERGQFEVDKVELRLQKEMQSTIKEKYDTISDIRLKHLEEVSILNEENNTLMEQNRSLSYQVSSLNEKLGGK